MNIIVKFEAVYQNKQHNFIVFTQSFSTKVVYRFCVSWDMIPSMTMSLKYIYFLIWPRMSSHSGLFS